MSAPNDDMEMEKIAEDELSKLQRQYRVMELERGAVCASARPALRLQRQMVATLSAHLENIMLELKLTNSTSNVLENARTREKILIMLKEHEKYSSEVREHRSNITELNFLLKQVQKEIKALKSKGTTVDKECALEVTNQGMVAQLENRLDTAMKKFNAVNSDNYSMRLQIDCLLQDRQFFNTTWRKQLRKLMAGKAQLLELVEQAIGAHELREESCARLHALREQAAQQYRKHCLEVRELQRQLEHSVKLEQFLRTKGTVRLTAADARAEARRQHKHELEAHAYNNHLNVLDAIKEFTGEQELGRLRQEFTRREEENYALFNYVNELHAELTALADSVNQLNDAIDDEKAKHEARMYKQQDSVESLRSELSQLREARERAQLHCATSEHALSALLRQVRELAQSCECESLPLLKLVGGTLDVSASSARLYLTSLEHRLREMVDLIKMDEAMQRHADAKTRTPPPARRARRAPPSPRPPRSLLAHA
ncbi:PREDICTED: coiled-coil domain-containing protein 63 [Papilio polytes]|uniref:coiled-coil domain-containing protein 63 n=1 Tax=Papilio polytes TaxID=76194 RepID=UPI000675EC0F|nr:PREDICTED: coiled-coil domain-containing protein 63 [Papilio polytes]